MKLNHVALSVNDREISANFYARWFGLDQRMHEDDHLLILSNSEGDLLALSEGEVPAPLPRTTHFGFQVQTTAQVVAMRDEAAKAELREAEWQESGPTRLQLFNPDGYRVEIYAF